MRKAKLYVVTCSRLLPKTYHEQWDIPEKIQTGDGGVEDMEFPGVVLKKEDHVEIPGVS